MPRIKEYRTNSIHLRCTNEEYEAFQQAAEEAKTSLNNLITSIARDDNLLRELIAKIQQQQK